MDSTESLEGNPFRLPPDDEIFLMREQERQRRFEERDKLRNLRVWEKTTSSSRIHKIRRIRDEDIPMSARGVAGEAARRGAPAGDSGAGVSVGRDPRREKENITDFVAKKREMFLVQMSLDVKKAEILKLDEKARMKEEALKKSQAMLDEDVTRFDTFLQANDAKAHKAMKQAEDMTKKKQERQQRIKQLRSQISAIQSEISKHKEQKEECVKFKRFLDKLTPQEWKEKQLELKRQRRRQRKENFVRTRMEEINSRIEADFETEEALEREKEVDRKVKERRGARPTKDDEEQEKERERDREARRRRIRRRYPGHEQVEKEYQSEDSGEEMPLYFVESKQLLDIFTALEEQNLFLIQNSQETEQALEEVEQKFAETKRVMGAKAATLKQNIAVTEKQIADERGKCEELKQMVSRKTGANEQDTMLRELASKVVEVHQACGFDADHDPHTLQMLGSIEAKLEELLNLLDDAEKTTAWNVGVGGSELVMRLEREKERERRERVRQMRVELQNRKNEERLKNSLLRSQAPVHKKTGKQIMFRSAPLHQARRVVKETDDDEEAERGMRIFGIYMGRDGVPSAFKPGSLQ